MVLFPIKTHKNAKKLGMMLLDKIRKQEMKECPMTLLQLVMMDREINCA